MLYFTNVIKKWFYLSLKTIFSNIFIEKCNFMIDVMALCPFLWNLRKIQRLTHALQTDAIDIFDFFL